MINFKNRKLDILSSKFDFKGVITGFITPILPIVLFFIGQNIKVRKLVPPEFKMITSRDTAACPENSHHFLPLNATDLPSTSKKYPLLVRLLTLSPHFIGILSLILFFIVVFTVSILTSKRKKLENHELEIKLVNESQ